MAIRRPKTNKNPPILSHDFVITNHADILSFVAMAFILGLLFKVTSPLASPFVVLQHNVTNNNSSGPTSYTIGMTDILTISFYTLISIVIHAVFQEFILDKQNRRLRLSKVKHSKFNESGQLLLFNACSAIAGFYVIKEEGFAGNLSALWSGYPHLQLSYLMKYYFIGQLSYWIHFYPELYFQKVKKDEIMPRVTYITLHLVFIALAYVLSLQRLAIVLLSLHYTTESLFHFSRLVYFSEKQPVANVGFSLWNIAYVSVRLISITLSVLTFWVGLNQVNEDGVTAMSRSKRILCLTAVCCTQAWLMWHFINFHLKRRHSNSASSRSSHFPAAANNSNHSTKITRSTNVTTTTTTTSSTEITSPMTRSRTKKLQ